MSLHSNNAVALILSHGHTDHRELQVCCNSNKPLHLKIRVHVKRKRAAIVQKRLKIFHAFSNGNYRELEIKIIEIKQNANKYDSICLFFFESCHLTRFCGPVEHLLQLLSESVIRLPGRWLSCRVSFDPKARKPVLFGGISSYRCAPMIHFSAQVEWGMQREREWGRGTERQKKYRERDRKKNTDNEERRTYFRSHAHEKSFTKTTFEKEKKNI